MDLAVEEDVEVRGWRATSCCRWESSALAWAEEDDEEDWRLLVLLLLLLREVVVCRGMAGREWEWECSWDGDGWDARGGENRMRWRLRLGAIGDERGLRGYAQRPDDTTRG